MAICTSASAMAAAAAIRNENGQRLTTLLGKMLRIEIGAPGAATRFPRTIPSPATRECPAGGSRRAATARRSTRGASAIPGAGASIAATASCGSPTSARARGKKSTTSQRGGNYGWRCREGAHDFEHGRHARRSGLIDPVAEYDHTLGDSITGGYVYRGSQTTNLVGRYLFGDFVSGRIWAWIPRTRPTSLRAPTQLLRHESEHLLVRPGQRRRAVRRALHGGTLHRINFQGGGGGGTVPATLSATGCVSPSECDSSPRPA